VPGPIGNGCLLTAEVCDECQADCRAPLDEDFRRLWSAIQAEVAGVEPHRSGRSRDLFSAAALKSLAASALLLMTQSELRYFPDALEWVSNPDQDCDESLFAESACRVYSGDFLAERSWVSLSRRVDDETTLPYLLYFLGGDGIVIQVHVPLCLR